jgi:hypothetical protein
MSTFMTAKKLALASTAAILTGFSANAAFAQDASAPAAPAAPASAAMTTPAMAGPLAANPNPFSVDLPDWLGDAGGKVYIGGAVSALAYYQGNPTHLATGDAASYIDLSNAQVTVQKTDGWLQFYIQAGQYSFPILGTPYTKSSIASASSFGAVPVAYLKLQGEGGLADFSIEGGKLPTLTGDEYNFTFENMNIERGLLWNVEPAISRGVQLNYADGPLSLSVAWTDGYYTNLLNTLSGMASYVFSPSDTLAFSYSGDVANPHFFASNPLISPLASGSLYDLIWTHTDGNWVFSPYFQYITTPTVTPILHGSSVTSGALLVSYSIDDNFKLAARGEYESATGRNFATAPNLIGFGAGSDAWSLTLTPTFQWKAFFARADVSYVSAGDISPFDGFGTTGAVKDQTRVMVETGVLF